MVDLSSYKALYIKTAQENIAQLKTALQTLSTQGNNPQALELAHRCAHTLKGKTNLMGDVTLSALAKTMEDIFYEVKAGQKTLSSDMLAVLSAGTQKLEDAFLQKTFQPNSPENAAQENQNVTSKTATKILVMEDDVFFQKFYSTKLTEKGFLVSVGLDGVDGLQKARQLKPDIILLDIIMPNKDGFEVLKELKQDPNLKDIPVIVFSSLGQEQDVDKAKGLGALDYVNKSFYDFDLLLSKITSLLKK